MNKDELMKRLMTTPVMSKEEHELREWIKLNRATLAEREPWEGLRLALWNGFSVELAYRVLTPYRTAITGQSLDNLAAMQEYRLDMAIEEIKNMPKKKEEQLAHALALEVWQDMGRFYGTYPE